MATTTKATHSRDQALEMAQSADTVIYTISTNISHIETEGDKVMRYFADETGGHPSSHFRPKISNQSFENIANELRHQYNLFYAPEPLKQRRPISPCPHQSEGPQRPDCRARKGYYARRAS